MLSMGRWDFFCVVEGFFRLGLFFVLGSLGLSLGTFNVAKSDF